MTVVAAEPQRIRAALAAAAQAGEFFRLAVLDGPARARWRPAGDDLTDLVASTASQLGTRETRVAASILQLGLAARIWSPVLGCALLGGAVPDLDQLLISAGPPVRVAASRLAGWQTADPQQLAPLCAATVGAQLRRIEPALPVRLSPELLRGNSASAMAGALGVLARGYPRLGRQAGQLTASLLSTGELRGSGELTAGRDEVPRLRRRSCCLYYRVPGGGLCGDCCLEHPPGQALETD